jgi:hypothetical protein
MRLARKIICVAATALTIAQAGATTMNQKLDSYVNAAGASRQTTTNLGDTFGDSSYYRDDVSFGSLQVRIPTKTVGINASFTPPSVDSGCGGIDAHLGSLSFELDADITGLLEAIPQQALGYAFHLALNSLSPMMDGIISDIQKTITELNQYAKNSCDLAQQGVDKGLAYLQNNYKQTANESGADSRLQENEVSNITSLAPEHEELFDEKYLGNLVYITLVSNDVYLQAEATAANDPLLDIIMSLSGTMVTTKEANAETTAGVIKGNQFKVVPFAPSLSLTLKEFIESDGNTNIPVLTCNTRATDATDDLSTKCLAPTTQDIRFTGMQSRIVNGYVGSGAFPGILKRIKNNTPLAAWTPEERTIFYITDAEIRNKIMELATFSSVATVSIIKKNAAIIAREYTYAVVTNMFDTIETAILSSDYNMGAGQGIEKMAEQITKQRQKFLAEYQIHSENNGTYSTLFYDLSTMLERAKKAQYVMQTGSN